jgi:hypothetical protein
MPVIRIGIGIIYSNRKTNDSLIPIINEQRKNKERNPQRKNILFLT